MIESKELLKKITSGSNFSIVKDQQTKTSQKPLNYTKQAKPKKDFSNIDDLLDYIQNDQPQKKPKKKKPNKQKGGKKAADLNSPESRETEEKLLKNFKEILSNTSVNANLYPKIKPNLSEDWIKSL